MKITSIRESYLIKLSAKSEYKWVLITATIVMLLISVPYLIGGLAGKSNWEFTGFVFGVEDGNSYIAKMLTGTTGAILFKTPYTPFDQRGTLIFLPYILLGKLAIFKNLHLQLVLLYHIFRFIAGILYFVFTYEFISLFIENLTLRRFGVILASLGGGLGWLVILLNKGSLLGSLPLEFYSPESFGFLSLFGIPHLALARALLLWGLTEYIKTLKAKSIKDLSISGLKVGFIWLLVGLAQPLIGMVVGALVIIYVIANLVTQYFLRIKKKVSDYRSVYRALLLASFSGLIPLPLVIYNYWVFKFDPILRTWTQQSPLPSPHPFHYILAYGLLLPFSIVGSVKFIKEKNNHALLLIGWVLFLPMLAYAPFGMQRRLPEAIWVAIIILALKAFEASPRFPRLDLNRKILGALIFVFPSTLMLISGGLQASLNPKEPLFLPSQEIKSFIFLRNVIESFKVVLSSYETGNALPAWVPARVVIGHGPESANIDELKPLVSDFYSSKGSDVERKGLLHLTRTQYVFWGPAERALGDWDPNSASYLENIYDQEGYTIFEVKGQH